MINSRVRVHASNQFLHGYDRIAPRRCGIDEHIALSTCA